VTLFDPLADRATALLHVVGCFSQIETLPSMSRRLLGEFAHFQTELMEDGLLK
jgi:hypothetical protein